MLLLMHIGWFVCQRVCLGMFVKKYLMDIYDSFVSGGPWYNCKLIRLLLAIGIWSALWPDFSVLNKCSACVTLSVIRYETDI